MLKWVLTALVMTIPSLAAADFIILQSTTSTQNSGLFAAILPEFEKETGIEVRVVAVGTGQALRNARNGDGDVLLVHAKAAEEQFVEDGFGVSRSDVMYNDFVIVGPANDPADVTISDSVDSAFQAISDAHAKFISRGDDSGTHKAEMRLWSSAGFEPREHSGKWYIETGSGMGATLNIASSMGGYALSDRATWLAFGNKGDLKVVFEGDPKLFNQYGVIVVNPARHPTVKIQQAEQFFNWILGENGQATIAAFMLGGQQLFFPNAPNQ